jgi:hypothetical protein
VFAADEEHLHTEHVCGELVMAVIAVDEGVVRERLAVLKPPDEVGVVSTKRGQKPGEMAFLTSASQALHRVELALDRLDVSQIEEVVE